MPFFKFLFVIFFQLRSSFSKAFGRNKSSGNLSEENGISASKLNSTTNGVHSELKLQRKVHFAYDKNFFFAFSKNEKKPLLHTKKIKIKIERYTCWKLYTFFQVSGHSGVTSSKSSEIFNQNNIMVNTRSISTSALDETVIDDLQRQLSAKNDLLTETRLEALSSASQMQALREQVAKLRSELR